MNSINSMNSKHTIPNQNKPPTFYMYSHTVGPSSHHFLHPPIFPMNYCIWFCFCFVFSFQCKHFCNENTFPSRKLQNIDRERKNFPIERKGLPASHLLSISFSYGVGCCLQWKYLMENVNWYVNVDWLYVFHVISYTVFIAIWFRFSYIM